MSKTEISKKESSNVLPFEVSKDLITQKAKASADSAASKLKEFAKFTKAGQWVHGVEETEYKEDDRFIVHPMSYVHGAVAFSAGEFIDEKVVPLFSNEPKPDVKELQISDPINIVKQGDGWKEQHGIVFKNIKGGTNVEFKTSSLGGTRMLEEFIGKFGERYEEDPVNCFPIIKLEASSYKHKEYGKIYVPVMKIVDWANENGEIPLQ